MNAPQSLIRGLLLGTTLTLAAHSAAAADATAPSDAPPASTSPEATHTLFMGVELAVQRGEMLLPVRDVEGASIIAKRKGKEVRIPTTGKTLNLKVSRSLKVTRQAATVDEWNVERSYTPATDPLRKFAAEAGAAAGADAVASLEQGKMIDAYATLGFASIAASRSSVSGGVGQATAAVDRASVNFSQAIHSAQWGTLSAGESANTLAGELAKEAYDALYITFKVSTPTPLASAYIVVLAQLREGEKTKAKQYNWVYAKELGEIGEKPTPVYIKQGGFPPGFVIEHCEVHLFSLGEEIATNVSPMRVELTKDEAFQYAAIEYVAQHKNSTLPADLAGGQNTEALRVHLDRNYRGGPIYVEVSKDGLAQRTFRDKDGKEPLEDQALLTIVQNLRFNPALSVGKPVDSLVKVKASPDNA